MNDPKEKALSHLKNRDKTEFEIRESLEKKGFGHEQIDETIIYLKNMAYINDDTYTRRYVEISMDKKRGPHRITRELEAKGIEKNIIEDVLFEIMDEDWEWHTASSIINDLKSKNTSLGTEKLLSKIINKLMYEGFSEEIINDVAEEFYSDRENQF